MSHDQRPGRVRVISSGRPAETPQRRRTDPQPTPAVVPVPDGVSAPSLRPLMMGAALFLVASTLGGVLVTVLGLPEMFGR